MKCLNSFYSKSPKVLCVLYTKRYLKAGAEFSPAILERYLCHKTYI